MEHSNGDRFPSNRRCHIGTAPRWVAICLLAMGIAASFLLIPDPAAACGDFCTSYSDAQALDQTCTVCEYVESEPACAYCDAGPGSTTNAVVDSDGDGLTDGDESLYGADPGNPDSDFDGIADGTEIQTYGTFPWTHDTDSDNVSDYREVFESFTNPLLPDTDGDGYSDSSELYGYFTDPNDPSSYPVPQGPRG